jgi:energy-coupling factor transport system permease protein
MMGKVRGLKPVILPLILNALGKADTLGLTIDMRGYRRGRADTGTLSFGALDGVVILAALALAAIVAATNIILV